MPTSKPMAESIPEFRPFGSSRLQLRRGIIAGAVVGLISAVHIAATRGTSAAETIEGLVVVAVVIVAGGEIGRGLNRKRV